MKDLKLRPSLYDPCFMYTVKCMAIKEINAVATRFICCLQTDDTNYLCNQKFIEKEKAARTRFRSKPVVNLGLCKSIKFNGAILSNN